MKIITDLFALHFLSAQTAKKQSAKIPGPVKKIIPKGCESFDFVYGDGFIFNCVALNKRSAEKKFRNFKKSLEK